MLFFPQTSPKTPDQHQAHKSLHGDVWVSLRDRFGFCRVWAIKVPQTASEPTKGLYQGELLMNLEWIMLDPKIHTTKYQKILQYRPKF